MTNSLPDDDPSSKPMATLPPKATPRPASEPVSRRLADLEARLAQLEGESGPPTSVAHRLSRRLDALEAREHHHAQTVAHLEDRLANLQSLHLQDDAGGANESPPSASSARQSVAGFSPRPRPSLARRVLDGLHYLRYVWRRLQGHEEGAFPDQSLKEVLGDEVHTVPSLGLVVLCQGDGDSEAIRGQLQEQTAKSLPYVTFDVPRGRLGAASDGFWAEPPPNDAAEALRHAGLDYLVTVPADELSQWPSTLAEGLQLSLAVEELDVLEILLSPTVRVLVQRPRSWHPLAHRSLHGSRGGQVGKIVDLSSAPMAAVLDRHFERRFGPYRFATAGTTLTRHRLAPAGALGQTVDGSTLVLSDDLLGGREQLFSDLFLRLDSIPWLLVGENDALTRQRLAQLQRLRRLDGVGSRIYPIGAMIPAPLRPGTTDWLARRWGAEGIMPLVSQTAVEAHPEEEPLSLAIASSLGGSLKLRFPPEQDGALLCHPTALVGSGAELAMESLRRQLDWSDSRPVVLWFGDLLAEQRPEDFLALAHTCRDDAAFLMIGRGPLEGPMDDLAGFLDLGHFRRLPSLPLSFAVGLSRVVCSTASREPLPYAMLAALESGRNILLPEGSELSRRFVEQGTGKTYPLGDTDSARRALLELLAKKREAAEDGAATLQGPLGESPEQIDAAWRTSLGR